MPGRDSGPQKGSWAGRDRAVLRQIEVRIVCERVRICVKVGDGIPELILMMNIVICDDAVEWNGTQQRCADPRIGNLGVVHGEEVPSVFVIKTAFVDIVPGVYDGVWMCIVSVEGDGPLALDTKGVVAEGDETDPTPRRLPRSKPTFHHGVTVAAHAVKVLSTERQSCKRADVVQSLP